MPGFDRAPPHVEHARKVIRMDGVAGRPILQFLSRLAEIFQDSPVDKLGLACRTQGADVPWNSIDDEAQSLLIRTEGLLGAFPLFKIGVRSVPLSDLSRFVPQRAGTKEEPAVFAVETA